MLNFIVTRLLSALIVVLGVSCIVFLFIHMIPGDPVEVMLGESARPADREALREALGLHLPLMQQLTNYYSGLLQFDLGQSLHSSRPVVDLLWERIPATLELALASLIVAVAIAFPLGTLAAIRQHSVWDQGAMGFALIGVSIPNFVMGPLLILLFSITLGWLPVSGRGDMVTLILPAITLGSALSAVLSRMVRASLLEVLSEDYVRTARAKGLSEWQVVWVHGVRNALLPVVTLLGLQLGVLLGGAVITETIFSWPGLGQLTIEAIQRRDYPVLQACILIISLAYVVVNTCTDLIYGWLDPRVRLGEG